MNRLHISGLATLFGLLACVWAPAQDRVIVTCPVTGVIDPGIAVIVKRTITEAEQAKADAIVFRIDTPGGRVDSAVDIASAITATPVRTIAYIEGMGAISAGALISFACDDIIMSPGSAIGAATPVIPTAEGLMPTGEKEVSFMRAKMRALAESNGHSPELAQAMVDKDIELHGYTNQDGHYVVFSAAGAKAVDDDASPVEKLTNPEAEHADGAFVFPDGSELIDPAGKLLTLTPAEAEKYGLIPTVALNVNDALLHYGLYPAAVREVEPNWAEVVFRFLTNPTVAGLLLMIGLGAIYYEIKTAGFGLFGIIGAIALMLLFGAHFVLGLADTIDLVLVLGGLLLILAEIFIIPGFGIAGIAGIVMLLLGTYLALVSFTLPEYSWQYERLNEVAYSIAVALVTFGLFVLATWKLLPRSPFYGAIVLQSAQSADQGYRAPTQESAIRVGQRGHAMSMLRPVGRARFGDATVQVVTRGDFLPADTEIEIIEVDGARVVVERAGGAA